MHAGIAQLPIAQAGHRVIFIQPLLRLGGAFDIPFNERRARGLGDFVGQHSLAGARLALYQQGPAQHHRSVHRHFQIVGGDIVGGAIETLHCEILSR